MSMTKKILLRKNGKKQIQNLHLIFKRFFISEEQLEEQKPSPSPPLPNDIELDQKSKMAVTLVKVAGKLTIGGFALYGLSEVLSSQDNTIKQISMLDSKTRENIPVNLPEVSFQVYICMQSISPYLLDWFVARDDWSNLSSGKINIISKLFYCLTF